MFCQVLSNTPMGAVMVRTFLSASLDPVGANGFLVGSDRPLNRGGVPVEAFFPSFGGRINTGVLVKAISVGEDPSNVSSDPSGVSDGKGVQISGRATVDGVMEGTKTTSAGVGGGKGFTADSGLL